VLVENVVEFKDWVLYPSWLQALKALGYTVAEHTFDAADFGVPQNRKRLFLTAAMGKSPLVLKSPKKKPVPFLESLDLDVDTWAPVASKPVGVQERVAKGRLSFPRGMFITHHVTGHPGRSLDRPIGTITTKLQWALVKSSRSGDLVRMLTVAEHRRAMGFPETYWLPENRTCDSVKLLGNAVCPPVAREIVKQIMERA
jgi:DNA (cytosine-5)-methyltransferase 1